MANLIGIIDGIEVYDWDESIEFLGDEKLLAGGWDNELDEVWDNF